MLIILGIYCAVDMVSLIERFMGPTWAHLGPTGPRWAPCWAMNFAIWDILIKVNISDRTCMIKHCCFYICPGAIPWIIWVNSTCENRTKHNKPWTRCIFIGAYLLHSSGLAQDWSNSIANTLELLQSCGKPSIYGATIMTDTSTNMWMA